MTEVLVLPADRARRAVAVVFAVNGLAFASWVARLPAVRDRLDLSPAQLGLLLLCLSAGSVAGLPLAGPVVHRLGAARAVLGGAGVVAAGLLAVTGGVAATSTALTGLGLVLSGLGIGVWDVAMNVEAADVERRLARPIMPRFHAAYSLGTVAGAGLGALGAYAGVPVQAQLAVTGLAALAVAAAGVRAFLPVVEQPGGRGASGAGRAWRERRTLLVGVLVLAFALTEGTASDWLAVALVDGHDAAPAVAALGYGAFVVAMTAARTTGTAVLARYGRAATLRATAVLAAAGLLLVVLAPSLPLALAGALLWGAGASLGFPVGMSAAADAEDGAAVRVSVVSSIGYTAFLAGPPLVGVLAESVGVLRSLLVVLVALAVGAAAAGSARETGTA